MESILLEDPEGQDIDHFGTYDIDQIGDEIGDEIGDQLGDQLENQIKDEIEDQNPSVSQLKPKASDDTREICRRSLRGACRFADKCNFLHPAGTATSARTKDDNTIEVCRKFTRGQCTFTDCKFAHPPPYVKVEADGRVSICRDYLAGRCDRSRRPIPCRYFHLPSHLMPNRKKTRPMYDERSDVPRYPSDVPRYRSDAPRHSRERPIGRMSPMGGRPPIPSHAKKDIDTSSIEVCRDFTKRDSCARKDCQYAHPRKHIKITPQGTATICWDFIRGKCDRSNYKEPCRYYHAESHLIKSIEERRSQPRAKPMRDQRPPMRDQRARQYDDMGRNDPFPARMSDRRGHLDRHEIESRYEMERRYEIERRYEMESRYAMDRMDRMYEMERRPSSREYEMERRPSSREYEMERRPSSREYEMERRPSSRQYEPRRRQVEEYEPRRRQVEEYEPRRRQVEEYEPRRRQVEEYQPRPTNGIYTGGVPKQLEICGDFRRSRTCKYIDCKFAHAEEYVRVKDNEVTVCFDYLRGRCNRSHLPTPCRYFHLPPNLIKKFTAQSSRKRSFPGERDDRTATRARREPSYL